MAKKAHVAEYKKKDVAEIAKLLAEYPVIAVVNVESIPASQFQRVRGQIRESVLMRMSKKNLISLAIDKVKDSKPGLEQLKDHLKGMPALMFTKENPFRLSAKLMKSKSKAPARAGQLAPMDIIIEAGPTPFAPGPIIGELGQLGIKTMVEGGKIAVREKKVLVKKGEPVSEKAASLLLRLGIQPMEIGLMPEVAFDNGLLFKREVLEIDPADYIKKIAAAHSQAINLAVEVKYPAKEVVELLITKAFTEAKAVGIEFKIIDKDIVDSLMAIADREAMSVKEAAGL